MGTDGFKDYAAFYGKNIHRKFGIFCDVSFDAVIYNLICERNDGLSVEGVRYPFGDWFGEYVGHFGGLSFSDSADLSMALFTACFYCDYDHYYTGKEYY